MMCEKVKCPYCGYEFEPNWELYDGDESSCEEECPECGKRFTSWMSISYDFDTKKADCLNGGKHTWKLQEGSPKCLMKMECTQCHEIRDPTEEERKKYHIGTLKEYKEYLANFNKTIKFSKADK